MTPEEALKKVDRLVKMYANKYVRFSIRGGLCLDDIIQAGREGVLEAHKRFKPEINSHFPTYAGWWIRAMIERECLDRGDTVRVPRNSRRKLKAQGKHVPGKAFLDSVDPATGDTLLDRLPAPAEDPEFPKEAIQAVRSAMVRLKDRERIAVTMRYMEDKNLREIGDHLGVCRERARQLVELGLCNLTRYMPNHVKHYL